MLLCDIHERQLRVCGQRNSNLWVCFARTWLQIPKRKRLVTLFINGNTRYRSTYGIQKRSCGIMKIHRRILPCIGAVIIVRMTKLEGSELSHDCCYRVVVIIPCQFRCFGKSVSQIWNCINKKGMKTEGEERLNRRNRKKTWWCRLYYERCWNNFLSKSSWANPSSGKQFQTVSWSMPIFLIYVCVVLVRSDVEWTCRMIVWEFFCGLLKELLSSDFHSQDDVQWNKTAS